MMSEPIHVTDAAFEKVVLQSELPVGSRFLGALVRPLPDGCSNVGKNRKRTNRQADSCQSKHR
jgi:hypothetical protein